MLRVTLNHGHSLVTAPFAGHFGLNRFLRAYALGVQREQQQQQRGERTSVYMEPVWMLVAASMSWRTQVFPACVRAPHARSLDSIIHQCYGGGQRAILPLAWSIEREDHEAYRQEGNDE